MSRTWGGNGISLYAKYNNNNKKFYLIIIIIIYLVIQNSSDCCTLIFYSGKWVRNSVSLAILVCTRHALLDLNQKSMLEVPFAVLFQFQACSQQVKQCKVWYCHTLKEIASGCYIRYGVKSGYLICIPW